MITVTEIETKKGLIDLLEPNKQCICFMRTVKDIERRLDKEFIGKFIDVKPCKHPVASGATSGAASGAASTSTTAATSMNKINKEPQKLLHVLKDKLKKNISRELVFLARR